MYFTSLPNHAVSGFDEQRHFEKFKKHNIIFNAKASQSHCARHVGCLSIKTVLSGEEWYGIGNNHMAIRPGQFLILNDDQEYSCTVDTLEETRVLSIFFMKEFASSVFRDATHSEDSLLDNPFETGNKSLEFFQTLYTADSFMQDRLQNLIHSLEEHGYETDRVNEHLVFLLNDLIRFHKIEMFRADGIDAIKPSTRKEVYKRICIVKDFLHSNFMEKPNLSDISSAACLSVPQMIRQFKMVYHVTPHQYLTQIRLANAARLLKQTSTPIHEITWMCGFDNVSAFCRAFKSVYRMQPGSFRKV